MGLGDQTGKKMKPGNCDNGAWRSNQLYEERNNRRDCSYQNLEAWEIFKEQVSGFLRKGFQPAVTEENKRRLVLWLWGNSRTGSNEKCGSQNLNPRITEQNMECGLEAEVHYLRNPYNSQFNFSENNNQKK